MTESARPRPRARSLPVPPELAALARAMRRFKSPHDRHGESLLLEGFVPDRPGAPANPRANWVGAGLPQVRSQGTANTCTSFAIAAATEVQWRRRYNQDIHLAPGFIHRCLGGHSDAQGFDPLQALAACVQHGIAPGFPGDYPYPPDRCDAGGRTHIATYGWVPGPNGALDRLAADGPIVADLYVERNSFLALPKGAIYVTPQSASLLLHTVLVVAYDFAMGWALVENSFGSAWCDGGFGLVRIGTGGGFLTQRGGYYLTV